MRQLEPGTGLDCAKWQASNALLLLAITLSLPYTRHTPGGLLLLPLSVTY